MSALRVAGSLALVLLWVLPVAEHLALPWVVVGPSMEPTLRDGDRVLVDRWTYRQRAPRSGEIALVRSEAGHALVKRIGVAPAGAPTGGVWVYGDNPAASDDSRRFGPVPRAAVRGRVVARYWPPASAGRVR